MKRRITALALCAALLLCAGANQARIHLTCQPRENPAAPLPYQASVSG